MLGWFGLVRSQWLTSRCKCHGGRIHFQDLKKFTSAAAQCNFFKNIFNKIYGKFVGLLIKSLAWSFFYFFLHFLTQVINTHTPCIDHFLPRLYMYSGLVGSIVITMATNDPLIKQFGRAQQCLRIPENTERNEEYETPEWRLWSKLDLINPI